MRLRIPLPCPHRQKEEEEERTASVFVVIYPGLQISQSDDLLSSYSVHSSSEIETVGFCINDRGTNINNEWHINNISVYVIYSK